MIRSVIVLCVLAATASAIPLDPGEPPIPILEDDRGGPNSDGTYTYMYRTANGIQADELGYVDANSKVLNARGSYSYTAPNGELVQVTYLANQHGFQPIGSHIADVISANAFRE
ncbi:cuticular protein 18 [Lasioglossum baleicum]|uniref:cuticular protein 18 n=1 Tax=Lasioglossum baleicum TaxID=434251 RepID=UPI003FCE52A0